MIRQIRIPAEKDARSIWLAELAGLADDQDMLTGCKLRRLLRTTFIAASVAVLACIPWVLAAEAYGWTQRPAHLLQSFLAIPIAFLSSGVFLWLRVPEGAPAWERRLAWVVCVLSGLWLLLMAWVFVALARGMFPGPA